MLSLHREPVKGNRVGSTLTDILHSFHTGNLQRRLGSRQLGSFTGGLYKTGTGTISDQTRRHNTGRCTRIKEGCSLVTTVGGFTGSTGIANNLLRSKASSRENLSLHLSSKLLRSSEAGLLLGFPLLGLGEPIRTLLLLGRCRFNRRWLVCVYSSQQSHI